MISHDLETQFLSKEELEGFLYKIRNTLCAYNYEKINNVIFFNNQVVFEYLSDIPLIMSEMTVGEALDIIGAFIPISLTEDSLKFIMQSANSPEFIDILEDDFAKKNKMEFLQALTKIENQDEWKNILALCETIREFRVNENRAVFS